MFDPSLFDRSQLSPRAVAVVDAVEQISALRETRGDEAALGETKALAFALKVFAATVGERLLEVAERDLAIHDGRQTAVSWASGEVGMDPSEAKRLLKAAQAARRLPALGEQLRSGWITSSHLIAAITAMDGFTEEQVTKADAILAEQARSLPLPSFLVACQELRETVVPELVEDELDRLPESSRLTLSRVIGGIRVSGVVYGEDAEAVMAGVNRLSVPLPDDHRDAPKRRMDALAQICRIGAGTPLTDADLTGTGYTPADLPPVGIEVIADLLTLRRALARDRAEQDARLAEDFLTLADPLGRSGLGGWLPACEHEMVRGAHGALSKAPVGWRELVSRFCDGALHRLVMGPDSAVLDLGHEVRLFSRQQRRALRRGDLRCQWPGCSMPWVEADHITRFVDGGATDVANGRLLCRFHHTLRHRGWRLEADEDGRLRAIKPVDWAYQLAQSKRRPAPRVA